MADSSVPITAGSGTPIRVLTALGAGSAGQQVITIADSVGNLLGSSTAPLPITVNSDPDIIVSGTITATDAVVAAPAGAGALVSGASTAGSLVAALSSGGDSAWVAQVTGLTSGSLYFEESVDSTNGTDGNWIAVNGRQTGIVNTVLSYSTTTNGVFRGNTSGVKYLRVRSVGTLTGTPAITIRLSSGVGAIFLNASIPAGTNIIGTTRVQGAGIAAVSTAVTAGTPVNTTNYDASAAGNVTFTVKNTVAATAFTGAPVLVFERSDDGISWAALIVVRSDTGTALSTHTLPANTANGEFQFDAAMLGANWVRCRITTAQTANGMTVVIAAGGLAFDPIVVVTGTPAVKGPSPATSAITTVSVTTSSLSILAANAARLGAVIYNESGAICYVALASVASLTAYTVQIAVGGYYEVPFNYTGTIFGITQTGTAVLRVSAF